MKFPKIKNITASSVADRLKSVQPMTQEEAAQGRTIKPFPYKFDTFNSAEDLKEYILDYLYYHKELSADWLNFGDIVHMPLNLRDDIFYSGVSSVEITCYKPAEYFMQDIIFGEKIISMRPEDPIVNELEKIINEIKAKK